MKNNYLSRAMAVFALIALLFFVSRETMANPVGVERARIVARTFLINNDSQTFGLRDVSAEAGFSNVYLFTTENSFVLIAADDCTQPILGYSLTSGFDLENMPENKAAWIHNYCDGIRYAIDHQQRASSEVLQEWNDLASGNPNICRAISVVAPLLQTQWNQDSPYNMLCPSNCVTGCVATAMAQVMKYWNYPQHGIGCHSYVHPNYGELTADFQSTTYDWDNMTNTYSSSSTYTQKIAVATLMYHCGVSVDMTYSSYSSYTYNNYVADALINYFNYSTEAQYIQRSGYSDAEWIAMLKADLDQNRPIQYFGTGSGGGHSFVCDGYNSSNYFHFNWGWGGYCDEYYTINNLNPGPGGIGSGSNGIYNDNQSAVFGVHPSECTANAPTNLSYTQDGRNVTLSWSVANGAANYNIYCNSNYIGNVSSTSFNYLAPFGNSTYFVRSVDSNGRLSLSSNAVTVTVPYQTPVVDDLTATLSGNDVNLSWTAPEWCYPQTPTTTLSYGDGTPYYSWNSVYFAHRHLAANLSQYAGKSVYKVSTYVQYPGTYSLYIYTKSTSNNQPNPNNLAFSVIGRIVTNSNVWYEFDIDDPIILTGTDDLWVVMKQENTGESFPTPSFDIPTHNINAFYSGNSPTNLNDANSNYNCSWFINTYLTDGTYSYNIYKNGISIANNVHNTIYNDDNLSPGTYNYYVKTNYYAGETSASNQVSVQIGDIIYYNITVSANPNNGGTVSGGGTFQEGQTCTVTATPNANYTFTNWTESGTVASTNASYTFTVNANRNLVANFTYVPPTYTVNVSANPTNGGIVTGGGSYTEGQSCTVTATPNVNYTFSNWTENGTVVSTNASYTFTVNENHNLVANFTYVPPTYTVSVSANPTNGGNVSGSGTYTEGQSCTVTATPNTNYTFTNWTENGTVVSTNANYNFTVTGNRTLVANFTYVPPTYTVSVSANPTNGGNVNGGGTYTEGQSCTVTSTPNANYTFSNWTENGTVVSTNASYTFTVNENHTLVANFTYVPPTYTVSVSANPTNGGTVSGGGTFTEGQSCTVTATAYSGYTFSNWTENGTVVSTNANYTFTVNANRILVANFTANPVPTYTISVSASPANGGNVSGGGTFEQGETCTVTATVNSDYSFENWTENGIVVSDDANYTFTVNANRTLVANFTANPVPTYTISVSASPANGGSVSGGGTFEQGETFTVTATANSDYSFENWTENDTVVSSNASYTFTVNANRTLVANFTANPVPTYTISVSASPANGGSVSGGGTFEQGETCTVVAVANSGYTFENWTENGTVVSADARYIFTVNASRDLVAIFSADPVETYTITATADPVEGGTVIGAGTYEYGSQATLKVIPNENYSFKNWIENGIIVSEEQEYSFTVTDNRTLVATLLFFDGLSEQTNIDITIFPNPAKDKLIIEVSEPINLIEIYNIHGALMYRQENCSEIMEINVENYAVGTYMIRLFTEDSVVVRRFVRE